MKKLNQKVIDKMWDDILTEKRTLVSVLEELKISRKQQRINAKCNRIAASKKGGKR